MNKRKGILSMLPDVVFHYEYCKNKNSNRDIDTLLNRRERYGRNDTKRRQVQSRRSRKGVKDGLHGIVNDDDDDNVIDPIILSLKKPQQQQYDEEMTSEDRSYRPIVVSIDQALDFVSETVDDNVTGCQQYNNDNKIDSRTVVSILFFDPYQPYSIRLLKNYIYQCQYELAYNHYLHQSHSPQKQQRQQCYYFAMTQCNDFVLLNELLYNSGLYLLLPIVPTKKIKEQETSILDSGNNTVCCKSRLFFQQNFQIILNVTKCPSLLILDYYTGRKLDRISSYEELALLNSSSFVTLPIPHDPTSLPSLQQQQQTQHRYEQEQQQTSCWEEEIGEAILVPDARTKISIKADTNNSTWTSELQCSTTMFLQQLCSSKWIQNRTALTITQQVTTFFLFWSY